MTADDSPSLRKAAHTEVGCPMPEAGDVEKKSVWSRHDASKTQHSDGRSEPMTGKDSSVRSLARFSATTARFNSISDHKETVSSCRHICRTWMGKWVNSRYCSVISVLLTIWALFADDIRSGFTKPEADEAFNAMVIVCLSFFSHEIVLSAIAKPDYFPGFFSALDIISTVSLVLDLTWIADYLEYSGAGGKEAKGGRTAKLGAGMGRVVRVLRLIRVVKLYKAWHEARQKRKSGQNSEEFSRSSTREHLHEVESCEDQFLDEDDDEESGMNKESVVGKRLSHLTTRKVVIMVLTMLIVYPNLDISDQIQLPVSPEWSTDRVWLHLRLAMDELQSPNGSEIRRQSYERELLLFIHIHNWYDGKPEGCDAGAVFRPCRFLSHLFWFGVAGADLTAVEELSKLAQLRRETVTAWEQSLERTDDWLYPVPALPVEARGKLTQPWSLCPSVGTEGYLLGTSLIGTTISGLNDVPVPCPSDLRKNEWMEFFPVLVNYQEPLRTDFNNAHLAIFFDARPFAQDSAVNSILTTCFICIVLCAGAIAFSADAGHLVLAPVEAMVAKVQRIRDDPLVALKFSDQEYKVEEKKRLRLMRMRRSNTWRGRVALVLSQHRLTKRCFGQQATLLETHILDRTIIKLGSLLALGFGVAGVEIVSSNMQDMTSGVNVMIPGSRVDCFIGIVNIDNFTEITQALKMKVIIFVNSIAEIVHGIVDQYHGSANKNNGDSFLLIWRCSHFGHDRLERLADMSMAALVQVQCATHTSHVLDRYKGHPRLQQMLNTSERVKLSCGLHFGWAIEGAVGSEFKIDASYLSPTISIVDSVERSTKVYCVAILATDAVVDRCSSRMAMTCRLIDKVRFRGSKEPYELFTIDIDCRSLKVQRRPDLANTWTIRDTFRARRALEVEKRRKLEWDYQVAAMFVLDDQVREMRKPFSESFLETFKMGYRNYSEGEWQNARRLLSMSRSSLGVDDDGPSRALLAFMESHTPPFVAPPKWEGVRFIED